MSVLAVVRREKWLAAVLVFSLGSALGLQALCALMENQRQTLFWQEFCLGDGPFAWLMAAMPLIALVLGRFTRNWNWRATGMAFERHVGWICLASALFYSLLIHWAIFKLAYTPDESSAVLQGRTLAALRLTPHVAPDLVALIIPAWLQGNILLLSPESGQYSPTYWPGFALLLAPFASLGLEWLCNPVLTALSLGLLFHFTARLSGSREAGVWALVLALASPQLAINAATYYAMPAHLGANLLFCWFFLNDNRRSAFLAGLVGGFALILHNPLPHLSFVLPWIVWMLRFRRSQLGPLALGYALLALPIGIGWSFHLDSFHISPYVSDATLAEATKISDSGAFSQILSRVAFVFRPPDPYLLMSRLAGLIKIVVWACPGLVALAWIGWRRAARESGRFAKTVTPNAHGNNQEVVSASGQTATVLWLLGASVVTNFVVYLFIRYDQGHGWGFRYMHQTWFAFPVLAAQVLTTRAQISGGQQQVAGVSLRRFCASLCVLGFTVLMPLRVLQTRLFMENVLRDSPPAVPSGPSITFIHENRAEAGTFIQNDPFLRENDWKLRFVSSSEAKRVATRYLAGARRLQSGAWGETWVGTRFRLSPSPVSNPAPGATINGE